MDRAVAEDAGTYVCTAVNIAGSKNVTVSVEIHGKTHVHTENITLGLSALGIRVSYLNFEILFIYKILKSLKQRDYFTYKIELGVVKTSKIQSYFTFLDYSSDSCICSV